VVHPALRRRTPDDQVDGHTRRAHRAPVETVGRRDRLDDQRGASRLRVVANYPRRAAVPCTTIHRRRRRRQIVKVKFSHTRYRALGPELIPVYRQSARR